MHVVCFSVCVSPHDELFSELFGQTCIQISLNKKNNNKNKYNESIIQLRSRIFHCVVRLCP